MMLINRDTHPARALYIELRLRPMATSMVLASVFIGVCALILGEGASRAFTIIGGGEGGTGTLIAHLMGALLVLGGLLTVVGIVRFGTLVELLGLVFVSAGAFIYGAGVLIGLGANGLIAGGMSIGLSVGSGLRVALLAQAAKNFFDREP